MNKNDLEFYYGKLVLETAQKLSDKPYDNLKYKTRIKYLDKSSRILCHIINSPVLSQQFLKILQGNKDGEENRTTTGHEGRS